MRADRREPDDIPFRTDALGYTTPELDQHAGSILVGIGHRQGLIHLEVTNIAEPGGRVVDPRLCRRSPCWARYHACSRRSRGRDARAAEELPAPGVDEPLAPFHETASLSLSPSFELEIGSGAVVTGSSCGYVINTSRSPEMNDTGIFASCHLARGGPAH
jgi:hypothetical protein